MEISRMNLLVARATLQSKPSPRLFELTFYEVVSQFLTAALLLLVL